MLRDIMFAVYNNECQYCGVIYEPRELEIEHIHPRARGGDDELTNKTVACRRCNLKKMALILPEPGLSLLFARAKEKAPVIQARLEKRIMQRPERIKVQKPKPEPIKINVIRFGEYFLEEPVNMDENGKPIERISYRLFLDAFSWAMLQQKPKKDNWGNKMKMVDVFIGKAQMNFWTKAYGLSIQDIWKNVIKISNVIVTREPGRLGWVAHLGRIGTFLYSENSDGTEEGSLRGYFDIAESDPIIVLREQLEEYAGPSKINWETEKELWVIDSDEAHQEFGSQCSLWFCDCHKKDGYIDEMCPCTGSNIISEAICPRMKSGLPVRQDQIKRLAWV